MQPTPTSTAPTTPPDIAHQSTHWAGGAAQQTTSWCFAAAGAIVQAGFGVTITQAAIAHQSLMEAGEANTNLPNAPHATDYYYAVQEIWATNSLTGTTWAEVSTHVTQDATVYGYLRGSYGLPRFGTLTSQAGAELTGDQMIATLDAEGLVVSATNMHFKVIYGYRRVAGLLEFHVYNPWSPGSTAWVEVDDVIAEMVTSFRVTN